MSHVSPSEAVPEPVFPEEDGYPSYRVPKAIPTRHEERSAIDNYVRSALIATGTLLVPQRIARGTEPQQRIARRVTETD